MSLHGSRWCSHANCKSNSKNNSQLSFFRFPRDTERCTVWIKNIGRLNLLTKDNYAEYCYKNCRLCSVHFREDMFSNKLHNRLHIDAIPEVYEGTTVVSHSSVKTSVEVTASIDKEEDVYGSTPSFNLDNSNNYVTQDLSYSLDISSGNTGIKYEFTDNVYHDITNIESIYIKSEPVDNSEFEDELQSATVTNTERRDTRKTYIISSTDDVSQYNYNTNIIIAEEIDIKSECGDDDDYEENAAEQDTVSAISSANPDESWVPVFINKVNTINTTQTIETCYKCDVCEKTFKLARNLVAHKPVHTGEKLFKCECNKEFLELSHLTIHKRTHTGEKPFKCDQCNKAFSVSTDLTEHKRIHSEKPFICDQCNKTFAQFKHLTIHKRTHSEEKFRCDQCNKGFDRLSVFIQHNRIHSGEKPFICDQCNKAFARSSGLTLHKRIHSGEKPFKCDQCDRAYYTFAILKTHKLTHSSEKPFKCDQCNKTFSASQILKRHKQVHSKMNQ